MNKTIDSKVKQPYTPIKVPIYVDDEEYEELCWIQRNRILSDEEYERMTWCEKSEQQIEEYEREEAEKERLGLKPIEEIIPIKPKVEIEQDGEPLF